MKQHILIIAAVDEEISYLTHQLERTQIINAGRRKVYEGNIGRNIIRILVTGPGAVNTAQALTACIEQRRPALIFQTGCAGTFQKSGLQIGDIGIATEEIDIHLGIEPDVPGATVMNLPFPVLMKNNTAILNHFSCHKTLTCKAFEILNQAWKNKKKYQVKMGPFLTVSTITATEKRATNLYNQYSSIMEAMEGAAAAHVSLLYDVPFIEMRAASNMVGERKRNRWNLPLAFENSNQAVLTFIRSFELSMIVEPI